MKKMLIGILVWSLPAGIMAQVPVSQEPMHHKVLDNTHVRLLDVHILPGDTSLLHIHSTPSVFLILASVRTGSQVIQEEDHSHSPIPHYGNIYFEGFYSLPRIHRVWNRDTTEFHVMDIELPNKNYSILDSPVRQEGFTLLFEEKPVRVYRVSLAAGKEFSLASRNSDVLIIRLTESPAGDFHYFPKGAKIKMANKGNAEAEFAFLELK